MSHKSRGNWAIGYCVKVDCENRQHKCRECVMYSEYAAKEEYDDKERTSDKNRYPVGHGEGM